MQRLFFHNRHDKNSTAAKNALDPDVQVIDVFESTFRLDILNQIKVPRYPYLIDREITLETEGPYTVGTFLLEFTCRDHEGNIIADEDRRIVFEIDGVRYEDVPTDGMMEIEITCPVPRQISIAAEAENYLPFAVTLEVEDA